MDHLQGHILKCHKSRLFLIHGIAEFTLVKKKKKINSVCMFECACLTHQQILGMEGGKNAQLL